MKTNHTLLTLLKKVCLVVVLLYSNLNLFALVPGDTIPSQKLNYIDPVSGKKCARLTTMGVANHATIYCGQDSSAETQQWSPDSKSVIIWFNVPPYPQGIYLMNVETGIIKFLAPSGNSVIWCNHAQFNPLDANEIIYLYSMKGTTDFVEIRGVKTVAPYTVRTIRRFDGISRGGPMLCMSHDGKFCYVLVFSSQGNYSYGVVVNMLTKKDHPDFPYRGPNWHFKENLQDGCLWNPKNNKAILWQVPIGSTTVKKIVCYDFDTGKSIPTTIPTSHATWSADGTMTVSPFGVISVDNQCLSKDGIKGTQANYYCYKHPFTNPAEEALGDNGHVIGDCVGNLNWDTYNVKPRYIYYFTWNEIKNIPWATMINRAQNHIGLWWGDESSNNGHPHMQMSPNGQYVVWVSNIRNRTGGSDAVPPGPKNTSGNGNDVDVFMMEVNPVQATSQTPAAPSSLVATATSSTQINLNWKDQADNETGYQIERKTGTGGIYAQIATVGAGVVSYNSAGLASSTQYYYRVRATNAAGKSAYSNEANATTKAVAPDAPTGLTATVISSSQINLSWSNGPNVTGFKIERWAGSRTFSQVAVVTGNVQSFINTELTPDLQYHYRIRATNEVGDSPYSNETSATTKALAPDAPTGLTATAISSSQINLTWSSGSNVTGFKIERREGSKAYAQIASVTGNVQTFSSTGLTPNLGYSYRIRATNNFGDSAYSNEASATTKALAPDAPTGLTATAISSSQINLNWSSGSNVTGFKIERRAGSNAFSQVAVVTGNVKAFINTGLTPNLQYHYRIRAANEVGDSPYSNETSATTLVLAPTAPTGLALAVVSANQINLSWIDHSGNETGFKIERKTGAGGSYVQIGMVGANIKVFNNTGLAAQTQYYYRVRATNTGGDSTYSNEANSTTLATAPVPAAPTGLTVTAYSASEVELVWKDQSTNEKNFKVERKTGLNGIYTQVGQTGANTTTIRCGGLVPNTGYYFRVRASNSAGDSVYSNEDTNQGIPLDPSLTRYLTPTVRQAFGIRKPSDSDALLYAQHLGRTPGFILTYANSGAWPGFQQSVKDQLKPWVTGTQTYILTCQMVMDHSIADDEIPTLLRAKYAHDPASLEAASEGMYDANYHLLGQYLNKFTQAQLDRLILRIGHEMNGDWYKHSIHPKGATPAYAAQCQGWYKKTWQRIHQIVMQELKGKRVLWDFCPSGGPGLMPNAKTPPDIANAYPGDDYVDIISIDVYTGNLVEGWGTWDKARNGGFAWMSNFAWQHGKLTGVGETNVMYKVVGGRQMGSDDYPEWFSGLADWAQEELNAHRLQHFVLFERDLLENKEWHGCVIRQGPIPGRENQALNFPKSAAKIIELFGRK